MRTSAALVLLIGLSAGVSTAQRIGVTVNGSPVDFPGLGPLQMQGRTLVPVRGVLEKLGAEVAWVPSTRSVIASTPTIDIQLRLGDNTATVNGRQVALDVPAQQINGHTMVPLRFLGEALGATVKWDDVARIVSIVTTTQSGADRSGQADRGAPSGRLDASGNPLPPGRQASARAAGALEPKISSINFKADDWYGWVQAGHAINIEMVGTPQGTATFRIPGVTDALPMKETEPGRYIATWTVPVERQVQLRDASIIGELQVGGRSAPVGQAPGHISVDSKPPTVLDRLPEPGTRVNSDRPNISAVFDDAGSGIWPPSMRLTVNGRDVTKEAKVTANFVSYTPSESLPPGETTVVLQIDDKATNLARTEWKFDVLAAGSTAGIRAVKQNAGKTLEPGDVLHVEMDGVPGGTATFSLGSIKGMRMTEGPAGHYATDYTIRKGDDVQNAVLSTGLALPDGQKFTRQADRAVSVNTGKPAAPVIVFPNKTDAISSPLVIRGRATPNSQVRVKVDYSSRLLNILPVQGTAADAVVTADRNGNWKTDPIDINSLLSNHNVDYTITATAVSTTAQKSDPTQYKFRLR